VQAQKGRHKKRSLNTPRCPCIVISGKDFRLIGLKNGRRWQVKRKKKKKKMKEGGKEKSSAMVLGKGTKKQHSPGQHGGQSAGDSPRSKGPKGLKKKEVGERAQGAKTGGNVVAK